MYITRLFNRKKKLNSFSVVKENVDNEIVFYLKFEHCCFVCETEKSGKRRGKEVWWNGGNG